MNHPNFPLCTMLCSCFGLCRIRFAPSTGILPPSQRRQHPIAWLAFASLVDGHDPELQADAARLVGEGSLGIHGCLPASSQVSESPSRRWIL